MPSSVTLTVAQLPTSTSFFLSALQPLQYVFRGKVGNTIGFGSKDTAVPADFWITQEIPGVPAGAAHVAFPASSHRAVQDFFVAALKAGGKIHGEPATRDASGYYSAAVIDFDGNSIEAVFRPSFSDDKENISEANTAHTSKSRLPPHAVSTTSRNNDTIQQNGRSPPLPRRSSEGIIHSMLSDARGSANVARDLVNQVRANIASTSSTSQPPLQAATAASDAILGTLFGVAAGAALHYAFTSSNQPSSPEQDSRPSYIARSTTDPPGYIQRSSASRAIPSSLSASRNSTAAAGQRQIAMYDMDQSEYSSTIRPASRRRYSMSGSSTSRQSPIRLLEAPPTSFRSPTAPTATESRASSRRPRSHSRSEDPNLVRSASQSSRTTRGSSHAAVRSRESEEIEIVRPTSAHPSRAPTLSESRHSRTSLLPSRAPSTAESKHSRSSYAQSRREPKDYPLPPSRAATSAGSEAGSFMSAKSTKTNKTITPRSFNERVESVAGNRRAVTKSVVSRAKDVEKLDVSCEELAPSDSVSQISVGSRRSRASRR